MWHNVFYLLRLIIRSALNHKTISARKNLLVKINEIHCFDTVTYGSKYWIKKLSGQISIKMTKSYISKDNNPNRLILWLHILNIQHNTHIQHSIYIHENYNYIKTIKWWINTRLCLVIEVKQKIKLDPLEATNDMES